MYSRSVPHRSGSINSISLFGCRVHTTRVRHRADHAALSLRMGAYHAYNRTGATIDATAYGMHSDGAALNEKWRKKKIQIVGENLLSFCYCNESHKHKQSSDKTLGGRQFIGSVRHGRGISNLFSSPGRIWDALWAKFNEIEERPSISPFSHTDGVTCSYFSPPPLTTSNYFIICSACPRIFSNDPVRPLRQWFTSLSSIPLYSRFTLIFLAISDRTIRLAFYYRIALQFCMEK